jgi:tetratricopeptide (TPR) repeat protein
MPRISSRSLALAVASILAAGGVTEAFAQSAHERAAKRRAEREAAPAAPQYPAATRRPATTRASSRGGRELAAISAALDGGDSAGALARAQAMLANPQANAYERAFAARFAAQAHIELDDMASAIGALQQVLEIDGLDNNGHYEVMLRLSQYQLQEGKYADSLATIERFLAETGSSEPEHLVVKGNALQRLERHAEAAAILQQAIAASPEPRPEWLQLLMATHFDLGQPQEAAQIAEDLARRNPGDKRTQLNLAAIYQHGDMPERAAAILEQLRAGGQLAEEREYRMLYTLYINMDGKEREAIAVINEGLQKGVLKEDHQTYLALAQAYYFSDQVGPAIQAYEKAAPLADTGETYLNLARLYWQADRIAEAKRAAQQALDKGLAQPEEARKILALPN